MRPKHIDENLSLVEPALPDPAAPAITCSQPPGGQAPRNTVNDNLGVQPVPYRLGTVTERTIPAHAGAQHLQCDGASALHIGITGERPTVKDRSTEGMDHIP